MQSLIILTTKSKSERWFAGRFDSALRKSAIVPNKTKEGETMRVLVACEESQRVCSEFRKLGHEAYSADILPPSGGHPEWHIPGDVLPIINGNCDFWTADGGYHVIDGKWDMLIAFPPCTHLAVSGARHFDKKRRDGRQREAIEFFGKILNADCDRICVENPVGIISGDYIKTYFPDLCRQYGLPRAYSQKIQPWWFGDKAVKTTCLWLKNLPELKQEVMVEPVTEYHEWIAPDGTKKRQAKWIYDAISMKDDDRRTARSKTFPGVAMAMANNWNF